MRDVTTAPAGLGRPRTTALDRLRTIALATALACTSSGAYASFASVVIDGLFVSVSAAPGSFFFAPTDTRNQAWDLQALVNGVLVQQNANTGVPNWDPVTESASGPQVFATVASTTNVDPSTQVPTPQFTLSATANRVSSGVYTALGNMFTSGSFCFWDENTSFDGTSASCTGAGSLTFSLFYDLIVSTTPFVVPFLDTAYAEVNVLGTGVPGGLFFDFASAPSGGSKEDQFFTWTADLTAGNGASFDLAGIVVAEAVVPEPGVLSLVALGLLGLALTRRRHGSRAAA